MHDRDKVDEDAKLIFWKPLEMISRVRGKHLFVGWPAWKINDIKSCDFFRGSTYQQEASVNFHLSAFWRVLLGVNLNGQKRFKRGKDLNCASLVSKVFGSYKRVGVIFMFTYQVLW